MSHHCLIAATILPLLLAIPEQTSAQPKPTPAPSKKQENNPHLEALGGMSAGNVYLSYAYVTAIEAGFTQRTYKAKRVRAMMDEVSDMIANLTRYLKMVSETNVAPAEKLTLQENLKLLGLVARQARALKDYAGTGIKEHKVRYDAAKAAAWPRIKKLLNIP